MDALDVIRDTHKWLSAVNNGIDSEDGKLIEGVSVGQLMTEFKLRF